MERRNSLYNVLSGVKRFPVIVTDVDGTLQNSKGELSPFTRKTLGQYIDWGGRIILATGKLYASIERVCQELSLKDWQITGNGAVLVDPTTGEKQVSSCLGALEVKHIETILNEMQVPFVYYQPETILYRKGLLSPKYVKILHKFGEDYVKSIKADFSENVTDVIKILSFVANIADLEIEKKLRKMISQACPRVRVIRTTSRYLEYMNRDVSKIHGLEKILGELGIGMESVIAFGDEENDLEILKSAGIGVAMGNASLRIKRAVSYVADSNDEDGVARFLSNSFFRGSPDNLSLKKE